VQSVDMATKMVNELRDGIHKDIYDTRKYGE
jgi:hypothetical protein